MVTTDQNPPIIPTVPVRMPPPRGLVVGNYCHDVLIRDHVVLAETLGGAPSFISAVHDGLSIQSDYVSKVGSDFAYLAHLNHPPIVSPDSSTTLFHALFCSEDGHVDRVLKRVRACDPILPSDLPHSSIYDFGMAVGVGGEIMPQTLEKLLDICKLVFVDIQALIRVFDGVDGSVSLVSLKHSGFFHLLPRMGFLKASAEEAVYMDVEEVRKLCCVVVTNGKHGCTLYTKDEEVQIKPFLAMQVDPTGAGDSFLGGFVAGLVQGLLVADAALLGNLFGSLTVAQIGLPKLDSGLLQRVKDEVRRRKMECSGYYERREDKRSMKAEGHEQFHASLCEVNLTATQSIQERGLDLHILAKSIKHGCHPPCTEQQKLIAVDNVYEEPRKSAQGSP